MQLWRCFREDAYLLGRDGIMDCRLLIQSTDITTYAKNRYEPWHRDNIPAAEIANLSRGYGIERFFSP